MSQSGVRVFCVFLFIEFSHSLDFDNFIHQSAKVTFVKDVISKFQNKELITENDECIAQLGLFVDNFNSTDDEMWALKMLDASAKIPAGVLEQNLAWMGRFDECLNIANLNVDVKGKYCLTTIKVGSFPGLDMESNNSYTKQEDKEDFQFKRRKYKQLRSDANTQAVALPFLALCIPDKCTEEDLQNLFSSLIPDVPWKSVCQTKETVNEPLGTGAILTICFLGTIVILMGASTLYDLITKNGNSYPLLTCYSIRRNGSKLFQIHKHSGEFSSLYGIKTLSMMWVLLGHTLLNTLVQPTSNMVDFMNYLDTVRGMFFVSSVHSVDTFFVMTGMLVVYSFMKAAHQGHKFNIITYYLHRYIRLTPALIPVILVSVFLTKYLGVGPLAPLLAKGFTTTCEKYWWTTLLYVQNYANENRQVSCLAVSWYLNVDYQLYLISPIFLLFLPKLPIIGLGLILAGTAASIIAAYIVTWNNKLVALAISTEGNSDDYNYLYYNATHTRAATWLIGCILGYVLEKITLEKNLIYLRIPKWLISLIWVIVLAVLPICIFVGQYTLAADEYQPYSSAFYNAFTRPAWGICIAWIIFTCSIGYGGIINSFLSLPIFQILSRFTYSMYLLHLYILNVIAMSVKEPVHFSLFDTLYSFWGAFALTFAVSIFWVLAFESPTVALERHFLGNRRAKKPII